jgi:YfiH family protein
MDADGVEMVDSPPKLLRITVPAFDAIPGLVHGFERRLGASGHEDRDGSRRRVTAALEAEGRLFLMKQVHGADVRHAPWEGRPEGDAAVSSAPGLLLGIETADCLPLLLVDPVRRVVAAAHAGWRGTALRVAQAAVAALAARGSRPEDLLAALGPANNVCCYEVGEELREEFGAEAIHLFRPGPRDRPHLDVRAGNVRQLLAEGVAPDRIHHVAECTFHQPELYHSYRREGPNGGRMVSWIGFRADR